jgi:hypothetical protein
MNIIEQELRLSSFNVNNFDSIVFIESFAEVTALHKQNNLKQTSESGKLPIIVITKLTLSLAKKSKIVLFLVFYYYAQRLLDSTKMQFNQTITLYLELKSKPF